MRSTLLHAIFTYLLCGVTCFIVYVLKWPGDTDESTEVSHVYYSFWQLLGLTSQMLIISAALILCITFDNIKSSTLVLSINQRRLMAIVAVINVLGGLVNTSNALSRSMAATFLLARYDQLSLYILPLSVSVLQIIVAVVLFMELEICSTHQHKEFWPRRLDGPELSLLETALSNHDVPYIIIMPTRLEKNSKLLE